MPATPLPENASLEHLKAQAKLVRDLIRSGDPGAMAMIDEFHPRLDAVDVTGEDQASFKTTSSQLLIARMYGFASWQKLRAHLALVAQHSFTPDSERDAQADGAFVVNACLDYSEAGPSPQDRLKLAHRMLADDSSVASGSIEALATVGDHNGLAAALDAAPGRINEPCGPNSWPPLLYATYSRISVDRADWSVVETVRLLLDRGANPNAGFLWRGLVPPFTALTGALGRGESHQPLSVDRLAIARLLLEAGADPNDGQGIYNNGVGGQNHDDPSHLELLVEFGLGAPQNGPWYERLGSQLREPSELLYDDLEAAITRDRPNVLRYLVSLGLELDRPVGRSQQIPARIAASSGHDRVMAVLAEAGIDTTLTPTEQVLAATRADAVDELRHLLEDHPGLLASLRSEHPGLIKNVGAEHDAMLKLLIELDFDIDDRSGTKTALHHAAEGNDLNLARLLIEHGADPNISDTHIGANPWGWAHHFGHDDVAAYLHPLTNHDEGDDQS